MGKYLTMNKSGIQNISDIKDYSKFRRTLLVFVAFIIIIFMLQHTLWKSCTWIGDAINLLCGLASVAGVVLAFLQIKQTQLQIKQTQLQIDNAQTEIETISKTTKATQAKLQKVLAISDLAKAVESIKIIYSHLKQGEYDQAHHRILEINSLIIEIKEMPTLKDLDVVRTLEDYGKFLATDLFKLQNSLIVEKSEIDKNTTKAILKNLNQISNAFAKLNAQLKHKEDERL